MCNAYGILKASDYVIPASKIRLQFFQRLASLSYASTLKLLHLPGILSISRIFQYLENLIISKECDSNMTLFENRVHALSKFFEMACIAGPWTSDTIFDYQLSMYGILEI